MKKTLLYCFFISSLSLLFSGCEDAAVDTVNVSAIGYIADEGHLVGAKVCIDENDNEQCDANELSTKSKTYGYYRIDGIPSLQYLQQHSIIAEITPNTLDESTGSYVGKYYTLLSAPDTYVISPISTLQKEYMKECNVSGKEAKKAIAYMLNTSIEEVNQDYITNDRMDLLDKAKIIKILKVKILEDLATNIELATEPHEKVCQYILYEIHNHFDTINEQLQNFYDNETIANNVMDDIDTNDYKYFDESLLTDEPTSESYSFNVADEPEFVRDENGQLTFEDLQQNGVADIRMVVFPTKMVFGEYNLSYYVRVNDDVIGYDTDVEVNGIGAISPPTPILLIVEKKYLDRIPMEKEVFVVYSHGKVIFSYKVITKDVPNTVYLNVGVDQGRGNSEDEYTVPIL